MVQLKAVAIPVISPIFLFQFRYGAIKSSRTVFYSEDYYDFNSAMVQLKVSLTQSVSPTCP